MRRNHSEHYAAIVKGIESEGYDFLPHSTKNVIAYPNTNVGVFECAKGDVDALERWLLSHDTSDTLTHQVVVSKMELIIESHAECLATSTFIWGLATVVLSIAAAFSEHPLGFMFLALALFTFIFTIHNAIEYFKCREKLSQIKN